MAPFTAEQSMVQGCSLSQNTILSNLLKGVEENGLTVMVRGLGVMLFADDYVITT